MDRMSTLDAEFLHLEDEASHLHIAGICIFDGEAPRFDELTEMVRSKLDAIPRYRQRVRQVPLQLGRPVWVDDPHFDLGYHLRHTALPRPGSDVELRALMGRLMSQSLDRHRPLWETWLVEGLEGDRWALIFKVHHCMVDGIAGVGLLTALLDLRPDVELHEPAPWAPAPEPSPVELVLDAWMGAASDGARWLRRAPAALADPVGSVRGATDLGMGLLRFGRRLALTPPSSIEGSIGPHRVWSHSSVDLARVKAIGRALGGTVNDVVLAAVTGGYRSLLIDNGDDPEHTVVRSLVPVSVRGSAGAGAVDNRVSGMLVELPVGLADPAQRLEVLRTTMLELKASHMAEAGEVVTELGNLAPPPLVATITRLGLRAQHVAPQRSVSTVTTNVPGPQFPLYCCGREMLEYLPYVPISHGVRVGTAILSYNGQLAFGITGDVDATTDVETMASGVVAGVDELAAAAGVD